MKKLNVKVEKGNTLSYHIILTPNTNLILFSALKGNPLLDFDGTKDSTVKRKWNDDVVFRNQTKGEQEVKKRFINDTIRNDFHKSFLKKYINL